MTAGYCRRRKIRCRLAIDDPEKRCENCMRFQQKCIFSNGQRDSVPTGGSPLRSPQSPFVHSEAQEGCETDFWTGARTRPRALSRHSSRNSSLRDTPLLSADPFEQSLVFPAQKSECSSCEPYPVRPSLPPPPKGIKGNVAFECELCGDTIKISPRLQWQ